jgi:cyclophilin family peptidyl-prolyl cis-trans isomerase
VLVQILKDDPQIQYVFRHFPLPSHDKAVLSAQAAEAAGLQGKFFEMNAILFENQSEWSGKDIAAFETWLTEKGKELGLDEAKFATDLKSDAVVAKVKKAQDSALEVGIPYTPFMIVNGQVYSGPRDVEGMKAYFDFLANKQFKECPPVTTDASKKYIATIKTEKGDVVAELYPAKAPITVNSFIFLAKNGWFDGVIFHRVIPGFVAQTGDPTGTGAGGPGYQFGNEISDLKFDQAGRVGMANAGPDTNGSQFFITFSAVPDLDGKYTVFGQVTQGLDVLGKLTERVPENGGALPTGDKIISVTVVEN